MLIIILTSSKITFQLKYVNVTYQSNSDIYVKYKEDILKKVLPICKEWFKPLTKNLKKLIKEGRRECKRILKEIAKINM